MDRLFISAHCSTVARASVAGLAGVTKLVALVSEIFVELLQNAAEAFGMTAFSGARKTRPDLSVSIVLGSALQIALFVAPVLVLLNRSVGPAGLA